MIAASRSFPGERGFSVRELTLTLLLLAAVVAIAVRLIDLRTRLLVVEKDEAGLGGVLEVAVRSLSRDLDAAGRGGAAPGEAVRPAEDNTGAEAVLRAGDAAGTAVAVRAGTDQLGLRGVIRSPLLVLGTSLEPDGTSAADRIRRDASAVLVRAGAPGSDHDGAKKLQSVIERLSGPARRGKRFFLAADSSGRYAVARVRAWSPPPDKEQGLELLLDFADGEAAKLNPRGEAGAVLSLGEPVRGGLFDDLVWFVARGSEGRPPDYDAARDPPSMKFPHPYLAVAEFAGEGRWEITRMAEDVEDLQIAWGLAGTGDGLVWRGDAAGSRAPAAADLVDSAGKPLLRALKVALSAKAESRYTRADGPRPPAEFPPLLNALPPGAPGAGGPVGWDPDESRRIPFERQSREVVLTPRGEESPASR
ncbi:MAG TPA: hypothetical protein VFZ57_08190 [Thermoanaerobaculia bacterium]|nr:hypothetical protein [Thermoanaerobaculia bacterium]